jgi:hypothetical protein
LIARAAAARRGIAATAAASRRGPGRRWNADRHGLRLAPEDHQHTPVLPELDDLVRSFVDDPDVVLRVDADGMGDEERVDALADLADEVAARVELKQPGAAMREQARVREADGRIAGPRVGEQLPSNPSRRRALRRGGYRRAS